MQSISATELQTLLQSGTVHLLDVRLPDEIETASLAGAIEIPLHELPSRHSELPRDKPIAVFCHHGVRSQSAARFLDHAGFSGTLSLTGGIEAWSLEIDPSVPRY